MADHEDSAKKENGGGVATIEKPITFKKPPHVKGCTCAEGDEEMCLACQEEFRKSA